MARSHGDGLAGLRDKYREMRRLREEDEAGAGGAPEAAMAALAARFPGALRQIDRLPLSLIVSREAALDASLEEGAPAPSWARLEIAYHGRMRATLRVKRALGEARDDVEALRAATEAWSLEPDEPTEPMNAERLQVIRAPAGGRLNPHVLSAVAEEHGVSVDEVRAALFPPH